MLSLARESRGMTQSELATESGIRQAMVSKFENGLDEPSDDDLGALAAVLRYPRTFFLRNESIRGFGSTCMYHRKRQSLSMRDLKRIHAKVNIDRMNLERLLRSVEIEAAHKFPCLDISEYVDPERIADMVRLAWHLPLGPIKNILTTIENAGGVVFLYQFETTKLDAISQLLQDMTPVFFINTDMPWERIRFSLAHEIGHLVMHRQPSLNQEAEADSFASAFLMPRREIRSQLSPMSLPRAFQLKQDWKVSMAAIIRRAYTLGQISESRYRRLFTELSKEGFRKSEPYPLPPEESYTLKRLISTHITELGYNNSDLCGLLELSEGEWESRYLPSKGNHIREVPKV